MIKQLHISNLALIDRMDTEFSPALNVITGETGAGKSIMLNGLSLILGKRADTSLIRDKSRKLTVEGVFDISAYGLQEFFEAEDLDYEPETIIRRELLPSGKSRAFVNDTPVRLETLERLGARLVDIHSQNQNLLLQRKDFRLSILDAVAGNKELLDQYRQQYREWKQAEREYAELSERFTILQQNAEYRQFQLDELNGLDWDLDIEQAEEQLKSYENRERILETLTQIRQLFDDETAGIMPRLTEARGLLDRIADDHEPLTDLANRWDGIMAEMNDILLELNRTADDFRWMDDDEAQRLRHQLDEYFRLMTKHRVQTKDELLALKKNWEAETEDSGRLEERLQLLKKQITKLEAAVRQAAQTLHEKRSQAIPRIEKYVHGLLQDLGMEHSRIRIRLNTSGQPDETGIDRPEFLLSSDKGQTYGDIRKRASGGEISRLMLAFKTLVAQSAGWPTLVFDEIDTGVSGDVARKMATLFAQMSRNVQIVLITHLPQIAVAGDRHFKVFKTEQNGEILSRIKPLDKDERIHEIAEMLEGKPPSATALEHARFLLNNSRKTSAS